MGGPRIFLTNLPQLYQLKFKSSGDSSVSQLVVKALTDVSQPFGLVDLDSDI